jgi:hypothetical protein
MQLHMYKMVYNFMHLKCLIHIRFCKEMVCDNQMLTVFFTHNSVNLLVGVNGSDCDQLMFSVFKSFGVGFVLIF